MRNPYQLDPVQAEHEARAKVYWGDSREEVIRYLMLQGIAAENATIMVDSMFHERAATIRGMGIRKIIIGSLLVSVPIIAYMIFASIGVIPMKLFAITVMVGLWGAWMLLKGILMTAAPRFEPGDVADK